jgi:malate synthase
MEDTATAEISRAQVWQWNKYSAVLDDGRVINPELVTACIDNVANNLKNSKIRLTKLDSAVKIFQSLCLSNNLINFLTLPAYEFLKGE